MSSACYSGPRRPRRDNRARGWGFTVKVGRRVVTVLVFVFREKITEHALPHSRDIRIQDSDELAVKEYVVPDDLNPNRHQTSTFAAMISSVGMAGLLTTAGENTNFISSLSVFHAAMRSSGL